jgi:uncharacterized SAM-binding protein YcdF (DUF218 family)
MNLVKVTAKIILTLAFAICVLDVSALGVMTFWRPNIERADAVIVLGAAINTPALYERAKRGLELYEEGKADTMVLSGGRISDSDISEAQYMEKVIQGNTTQPVRYILEENSHSTYDNIYNSKAKLSDTADSVIIVSDEFHLARAVLLAKRAGFEKVYWSAPEPFYYSHQNLRFYYTREFFAMLSYIPRFLFG